MTNNASFKDQELLYDPLFETPPDTVIRDTPGRGFFGKAVVKKTLFILILFLFVGASIALSFSSLSKDRFRYKETEDGWMLTEFNAGKTDAVLEVGPVFARDGSTEPGKTVTAVREFALCCNEYTSLIFIGKDVLKIPDTAFYSCSSLQAVLVDEANPCFCSVDGVLYRRENGRLTELMLYPARSDLFRAMLALGETPPAAAAQADAWLQRASMLEEKSRNWLEAQKESYPSQKTFSLTDEACAALLAGLRYEIEPGVVRIGEMAFAECETLFEVSIPDGVKEFASMAFFKCGELRALTLPASAQTIGSDAFSYCAKVPEIVIPAGVQSIGHHAFYGCDGVREIRLLCSKQEAPACGQDWLPKKRKLFLHDVPVVYGDEGRED